MAKRSPDHRSQISSFPLFRDLPADERTMIETILVKKDFMRGETIFSEGSQSGGFYIIVDGRVKVYKLSMEGKEQTLNIVGPGELLGAVPAFSGTPYPANADALEKARTFFFPRKDFLSLIRNEPSVAMNMMASLAARLQHFTRMIEDLSLKEVPGRLAAYLLYMCEQKGCTDSIQIEIPKGQLASLLGTIPETLSRILRRMSEKNMIRVKGRSITLINKNALRDVVHGEGAGI